MMQLINAMAIHSQTAPGSAGGFRDGGSRSFIVAGRNPRQSRGLPACSISRLWSFVLNLLLLSVAVTAFADEPAKLAWPQFRGPAGSGIAEDQKPPVELNRAIMEKFRPQMRKHYLTEKPEFTL